jgi:hypothetical protein
MKSSVLIISLVTFLVSCQPKEIVVKNEGMQSEKPAKGSFQPIGEFAVDIVFDFKKEENSEIRIISKKSGEVAFSLKIRSYFSQYLVVGELVYVSILDSSSLDGNLDLWKINIGNGTIEKTGIRLFDDFKFDNTTEWICYTLNELQTNIPSYPGLESDFPVIVLQNLKTGESVRFEKSIEMDIRPTHATIEVINNGFRVKYFADSSNPFRIGFIEIKGRNFIWEK